jgi:hypothetical protein
VTTKIIFPNYGTQGEVHSYNFDLEADAAVTVDEILKR